MCNDFSIGPDKALYITDTANGKIYKVPPGASTAELFLEHRAPMGIAENHGGKISVITVNGDKAGVTVIKEGLKTPTGVEPTDDTPWIAERGAGKAVSIPMPK